MKKILIVICLLIITLLFCEKDEINYQKNVDLELVGYEYNVNEQIYTGNKKQINVEGVIYVYPFNSSKTFFYGSINSSDYVFDYENYIIFYGILGNKFPEYTISIDSRKENISYYIVSFYGDLDFNDFIYVEYNENCKTKINSDTKLDQPGEYTIYTSYLNKHELEENFNDRYKIK